MQVNYETIDGLRTHLDDLMEYPEWPELITAALNDPTVPPSWRDELLGEFMGDLLLGSFLVAEATDEELTHLT